METEKGVEADKSQKDISPAGSPERVDEDEASAGRKLFAWLWSRHLIAAAVIFFSVFGVFYLANFAHFNFDDHELIVNNPTIRDFRNLGVVLQSGRPARAFSYMVDYALFELDPRGYHVHNLVWHTFASLLLYAFVVRLTRNVRLALMASFLFAIHPVHVEAVMSIAHRKEMMALSFLLLAFHAYLFQDKRPLLAPAVAFVFFVLAILSKQVTAVFPLLLLFHEFLRKGRGVSWKGLVYIALLLTLALSALYLGSRFSIPVLRDFNIFGRLKGAMIEELDFGRNLATAFSYYPRYLRFLLFPVHQSPVPKIEFTSFGRPWPWLGMATFISLPLAAFALRKNYVLSFSVGWIFINLLPVMNWIPQNSFFAERYLYIPSAGFCILLAAGWDEIYKNGEAISAKTHALSLCIITYLVVFAVLLGPLALRINVLWPRGGPYLMERSMALLISTLLVSIPFSLLFIMASAGKWPRPLIRRVWLELPVFFIVIGLGLILAAIMTEWLANGRLGAPLVESAGYLERYHSFIRAHARPGPRAGSSLLMASGTPLAEWGNALFYSFSGAALYLLFFVRMVRWASSYGLGRSFYWMTFLSVTLYMLSFNVARVGDWSNEIKLWSSVVAEDPDSLIGWNNLGKAYMDRKRFGPASEAFKEATRLAPERADAHGNLAVALLGNKDLDGAAASFARAAELNPADASSRMNLANLMVLKADSGKDPQGYVKAVDLYMEVLRIERRSAHALYNMAYCHYNMGALDLARSEAHRSLLIHPGFDKARLLLEKIDAAERASKTK